MSDEAQVPGSKAQKAQMSAGNSAPVQTCSHKLDGKGWCGRCKLSATKKAPLKDQRSGEGLFQYCGGCAGCGKVTWVEDCDGPNGPNTGDWVPVCDLEPNSYWDSYRAAGVACPSCGGDGMSKEAAIDDGAIGNREMESGDISVQHSMPGLNRLFPGDAKEQNQGASRLKEDDSPDALDPIVTDQRGTDDTMGWFQPTRFPAAPHRMQIQAPDMDEPDAQPASSEQGEKVTAGINPSLMAPPAVHPGSDRRPGRKSVPTGEGGVIGIPGIDGSSEHVVDPDESEKPVDEFKGGQPASNTVTDEFSYPKQKGQVTRQVGTYQFAAVEIFNPIDGDDLLLDL